MARAPIEIGIASETKAFKQGIESGVIKPVEDAIDALDDLGKTKGPEKLERELEQAQKATKNLDKEVERTADDIEKEFRDSYRSAGRSAEEFHKDSGEAVGEFKQEALANFSEVTSSFDGSMESITDLAQGTFGGLAAGLAGPLGLAAGAVALGIGGVAAAVEGISEATEESGERASEWGQKYIDAAGDIIDAATIAGGVIDIAGNTETRKNAQELAKIWGVDLPTAYRALAGDATALAVVTDNFAAKNSEYVEGLGVSAEGVKGLWGEAAGEIKRGSDEIKKLNDEQNQGREIARDVSEALLGLVNDAGTASQEVDELGNKLLTLPDGTQIFIDADTQQATTNVDRFKGDLDGVPETVNTTVKFDVDDSAVRRALEQAKQNARIRLEVTDRYGRNI